MADDSPAARPWPTAGELAALATATHWELEQAAYDLPAGRMTAERELKLALMLEQVAALLRSHAELSPRQPS